MTEVSPVYSEMTMDDYDEVFSLWESTAGIGLTDADSRKELRLTWNTIPVSASSCGRTADWSGRCFAATMAVVRICTIWRLPATFVVAASVGSLSTSVWPAWRLRASRRLTRGFMPKISPAWNSGSKSVGLVEQSCKFFLDLPLRARKRVPSSVCSTIRSSGTTSSRTPWRSVNSLRCASSGNRWLKHCNKDSR